MQSKNTYRSQRSYYMPGANAVAPEYDETDLYEEYNQPTETIKSQKKIKLKFKNLISENMKVFVTVFALATLVVGQYVYIAGLGYNIVREENSLNAILNSNEKLKQEYANLNDLSNIESYAVNNLGMVKASTSMVYVAATLEDEMSAESNETQDGVVKNIISGVMGIFTSY